MRTRPAGLLAAPRIPMATLPTALHSAPRLSEDLGIEVWLKRDDQTGVGLGGNKGRKLEFLLADMAEKGGDVMITGGGPQSNHIQITAAACARLGLGCHVVLYGTQPDPEPVNLALTRRLGAGVSFTGDDDRASVDPGLEAAAEELRAMGLTPYVAGRGGATPVGCLGYVEAAYELADQLDDFGLECGTVVLATGSCGTHAGLLLGTVLAGVTWDVVGATVSRPIAECEERIVALGMAAAERIGVNVDPATLAPDVRDAIGPGYGKASEAGRSAAGLGAATEGLLLDPVYTAKAMGVLIAEARAGTLKGPVVFLHTGGAGGLMGDL